MVDKPVWLLVGVGVGIGIAAGAWWLSRSDSGLADLEPLQSEPLVRQHVVHRNDAGLIESVETTTFPGVGAGAVQQPDVAVVQDDA